MTGADDDARADRDVPTDPAVGGEMIGDGDPLPGGGIVRASWASTALLAVAATVSVAVDALQWVVVPVAILLAAVGFVAFVSSYVTAIGRSRTDQIAVASLYFLIGCAPKSVQRSMMWSFVAQIVIALGAASMRPYTAVAFAILAPMDGIGLAGLWGARHGTFPPRRDPNEGRVPRGSTRRR